ncbi:50S ribosomal protein L11 [Candidatus Woesearchaeota archaeon CG_4_10_14_0_2_um_filter_33_10]|nr:MAG: 50S ribosomal protein L11 [Candidatus Woesearchaeota archaeon CG1_02_33_12]PIN78049.1 MAG: 50S ribosomal protein L11 [Candidatus Woesearchaeota archaeon CG10_big_fil_rev_8_21_14_0_10_33_12]PIU73048.1 MAG: 50S ribosomal protein L11 [Candidatus Woesearchaeota archaeon CG06_land_8_20_14_3_00_33_13]PIZ52693.1 MAG: 50S ribosomal protein L11 [Candidatus Woesearchaeota archaeon CG_4_10_14_0_2_um_filter_33_10]
MGKKTVEALIEGGKATAAPPLGPALGPLGVNIGQIIADINKKTAGFKGMQVPVKIVVDEDTKEYKISVGTPPCSSLIIKEAGIEKGSSNPKTDKVADLKIEQIIKIAKMKEDSLLGKTLKEKIKEIVGTCRSMGILVEGKPSVDAIKEINEGKFDKEIKEEKTEISAEELKELNEEKKKLAKEMEERREEFIAKAKEIISKMEGKSRGEIKTKLVEALIPSVIVDELLPVEAKAGEEAKPVAEKAPEKGDKPEKK